MHFASAMAGVTGHRCGAFAGSTSRAAVAQHRSVNLEFLRGAEGSLGQLHLHPHERILAPTHARARPPTLGATTEEGIHHVGEGEACATTPTGTTEGVATQVIHPTLLGV